MQETPRKRAISDSVIRDAVTMRQVATLRLSGMTLAAVAKQMGLSVSTIRSICDSPNYQEMVEKSAEDSLGPALAQVKHELSKLARKAVRVVEIAMDRAIETGEGMRDGLDAAGKVLRAVGLHEEAEKQQDTVLNIVMPGGIEAKTISVPSEVKE